MKRNLPRGVWQNGGDLGDLTQKPAENALFQKGRSPTDGTQNLHGLGYSERLPQATAPFKLRSDFV
jgi:hypothetical protein